MTHHQYSYRHRKLPNLLFGMLYEQGRMDEILNAFNCTERRLLQFIMGEKFPTEQELKNFCNTFKMRYSTLKTWNVLHIDKKTLR